MKKVSVIVPVYNVEAYIADTVQSILQQTYFNLELLIVDDGSPDRSVEICQQFTDARIKILRQPNRGVCAARNHGIREAQGDYLAFLDGDDLWVPEKLEKQVRQLESSPQLGLSFCHSAFIDEAGSPLGIYQISQVDQITPELILCRNPIGNGSTPLIRREALQGIAFPDPSTGEVCYFDPQLHHIEDVECWLRIALLTDWQMAGIPEPLTLYRVTTGSASAKLERQIASLDAVLEKTRTYAPGLIANWGSLAKAYQLRFLARRAVRLKAGTTAVDFAHRALQTDRRILWHEPRRTLLTLAAAYSLCWLPPAFYRQLEAIAMQMTGASQQRRVMQNQSLTLGEAAQ